MSYSILCFDELPDGYEYPSVIICGICETFITEYEFEFENTNENCLYWCPNCYEVLLCITGSNSETNTFSNLDTCVERISNLTATEIENISDIKKYDDMFLLENFLSDVKNKYMYKVGILNINYIVPANNVTDFFNARFLECKSLTDIPEKHSSDSVVSNCQNKTEFQLRMSHIKKYFSNATIEQRKYFGIGFPIENSASFNDIYNFNKEIFRLLKLNDSTLWYSGKCSKCEMESIGYIYGPPLKKLI